MSETAEKTPKSQYRLFEFDSLRESLPGILILATILLMIAILLWEGRIWWCKWDTPLYLATLDAWGKHTSQHFLDPYFFTHLLHGFLFLWILDLFSHKILKRKVSFAWLLLFAVFAEVAWEVLENSTLIIERYRNSTASLDYFGDSVANSISDVMACALGFIIAYELKFWHSLLLFVLIEIVLILTIHDSLLINIIMLIYPIEAIKLWQTAGGFALDARIWAVRGFRGINN